MDKDAYRQAWEQLHKARSAHRAISMAQSYGQQETAWSDFLDASWVFFNKLQAGARGHGRSEPSCGRIKRERENDSILQYVRQARNSKDHGIKPISARRGGTFAISGDVRIEGLQTDSMGNVRIKRLTSLNKDRPVKVHMRSPHIELITVYDDLHGDSYDPPRAHLGRPVDDLSAAAVSDLALQYMERVIGDASKFTK